MAGPGGREVGRISIRALPNTSSFATSLQRYLDRIERRAEVRVRVAPDMSGFAQELTARLQRVRAKVGVGVTPDPDGFQERLDAAVARVRAKVKVPIFPDMSTFKDRLRAELRRPIYARATVPVVPSLTGFATRLRAELRTVGPLPVQVQPTTNALAIARLRAELAHLTPPLLVPVTARADRRSTAEASGVFARLGRTLSGFAGAAAPIAKWGTIIASAIPAAAGLTAALEGMAPAAALGATGIVGLVSAVATLKIGTLGVSDAVKAAFDPKQAAKFEKALAKLTPNARAFVLAIKGMQPEFAEVRKAVQQRLFDNLGAQITKTATVALPVFKRGLTGMAGLLNQMGAGVLRAVQSLSTSGALGAALEGARKGFGNLSRIPGQFVTGLTQIAAAAAPVFGRLTDLAGGAADRLAAKIAKAFKSGALTTFITNAVAMVQQLFTVLGNIGSIVNSIFSAAQVSGGGFLGTLQTITSSMKAAFASPAVQTGLKALFGTLSQLAQTAGPLLASALGVVGQVLAKLGPPMQSLIRTLGAALQPVIKALGPVLASAAAAVGSLVTALAPLLPAVGRIVAALLPAIQPVFGALGRVFQSMAPVIQNLATGIGAYLAPVLSGLATIIGKLINGYADQLVVIFDSLAPVMPQIATALGTVGMGLGRVFTAVAPLLPQLTQMGTILASQLLPALVPLIPPIAKITSALVIFGVRAITGVAIPALQGLISFVAGLQRFLAPAIAAVKWVTQGVARLFEWLYDHLVGHSVIPDMVRGIVSWLASLPGKALSAISSLPGYLAGKAADAASRFASAIKRGLDSALSWIRSLPGRAASALGGLGGILVSAGASLIGGFVRGIQSMVGSVRSTLGAITSKLTSWKGPPRRDARILTPAGRLLISGFIRGIDESTAKLRQRLESITKALPANVRSGYGRSLARSTASLRVQVTRRDKVIKSLAAAEKKLTALAKARSETASKIQQGIIDDAKITGSGDATTASAIAAKLKARLAAAKRFASDIATLRKRGLRADLLDQLGQAGVQEGGAAAAALAKATTSQLKGINSLQKQLVSAASSTGNSVADAMYKSGVQAAQGVVAGLRKQKSAIERTMISIAKAMQTAIRRALGIHSPARKLMPVGANSVLGIVRGLEQQRPALDAAMRDLMPIPALAGLGPDLAVASAGTGEQQLVGHLVLDSGEFLGVVSGTVRAEQRRTISAMRARRG